MSRQIQRGSAALVAVLALLLGLVVVGPASPANAAIDTTSATLGWRPVSGSTVFAVIRVGDKVILGGQFDSLVSTSGASTATRHNLAALNAATGALLPWAPNPDGAVRALAASPDGATVYVGGTFSSIGSARRTNVAAVSASTGAATAFDAGAPNSGVRALLYHEGSLFVGGTFGALGSHSRGNGAELDPATGALRAWNPRANWGIFAMIPSPDSSGLFIGGPFSSVAGQARAGIAKVGWGAGALRSWTAPVDCVDPTPLRRRCDVFGLVADRTTVYAAAGGPGGRITAFAVDDADQRWITTSDGDFQTIALDGDTIYGGGHFAEEVNGQLRAGLVALDKSNGRVLSNPDVLITGNTAVWSLLLDGSLLRVGGIFGRVGTSQIGRYTTFRIQDPAGAPRDASAPLQPGRPVEGTVTSSSVALSWDRSWDNVAVTQYRVLRDGRQIGVSGTPAFVDRTVSASTTYTYSVLAADAAGNVSGASEARKVTTAKSPTPTPTPVKRILVSVAVAPSGYGNVLSIDMNPNRGSASYAFRVQRSDSLVWTTLPIVYHTAGSSETSSIPLPRGTYRVVVPAAGDYAGAVSKAVALTDPTVKALVSRNKARSKLKVNVNPNKGSGYWSLRVQKRNANGTWSTLAPSYRTKGTTETRTINLKKGTYRVVVAGKYGYRGSLSAAVTLVK